MNKTAIQRFESKFTADLSGCWNWKAGKLSSGYGLFFCSKQKRSILAHRAAITIYKNIRIPKNKVVMHKCDNPKCVNPDHLLIGTPKENTWDCINKGRFKRYVFPVSGVCGKGHDLKIEENIYRFYDKRRDKMSTRCKICMTIRDKNRVRT